MRSRTPARWRLMTLAVLGVSATVIPLQRSAQAAAPVVTISATGARIEVSSATLAEIIDALARAAGFTVTYEGARPSAMLFNTEIDTPSVPETLTRLLQGQNVNHGIVFNLAGTKVTTLLIFGTGPKTGGASSGSVSPSRPQPFATPGRNPRATTPPVDDDPLEEGEAEPEPTPETTPTPAAEATELPRAPTPISPFAPRQLGRPFPRPGLPVPQPAPTPSPSP